MRLHVPVSTLPQLDTVMLRPPSGIIRTVTLDDLRQCIMLHWCFRERGIRCVGSVIYHRQHHRQSSDLHLFDPTYRAEPFHKRRTSIHYSNALHLRNHPFPCPPPLRLDPNNLNCPNHQHSIPHPLHSPTPSPPPPPPRPPQMHQPPKNIHIPSLLHLLPFHQEIRYRFSPLHRRRR